MVPKEVKVVVEGGEETACVDEPVSPTGQYFNSSVLSVAILAVFETDVPIDDSRTMTTLENLFLPINPRFSSVMVTDETGIKQWKRVKVELEDHVNVPVFPSGLEFYDDHVQDYISRIAMDPLPQSRPLWEIHIIKYPTRNAQGNVVFKLHHALGDGFSLMGALFSCLQRADDPSLPLTFPSSRAASTKQSACQRISWKVPRAVQLCVNTIRDFTFSVWKSNVGEDDITPLRSGATGTEFRPISICSIEFSLDDIRKIKAKLRGTVNDVITGVIFYGSQLYMQAEGESTGTAQVTALVLLNTRVIGTYQTLQEMSKPDAMARWGNNFGFLHVSIPKCENVEKADPLYFVRKAGETIQAKRSSLAVYFTGRLLEMMRKLRGPEATAKYIHATLKNTSMTISNLTGPMEQILIAGHPIKSFHFMVVGVPQSLTITVCSYMGKLKVTVGAEKGFINAQLLISHMEKSFQRIFEAAVGKRT